jgi:hypothetical protein
MDCKYAVVQSSGAHDLYWVSIVHTILPSELWSVTEVSEETRQGLVAESILKSAVGRRNR